MLTESDIPEFRAKGKVFVYKYDEISVLQAEYAVEYLDFKQAQMQRGVNSFGDAKKSGGAAWLSGIMAFLLTEKDGDNYVPFSDIDAKHEERLSAVSALPVSDYKRLEECFLDFFESIGKKSEASAILSRRKNRMLTELLSNMVQAPQQIPQGKLQKTKKGI